MFRTESGGLSFDAIHRVMVLCPAACDGSVLVVPDSSKGGGWGGGVGVGDGWGLGWGWGAKLGVFVCLFASFFLLVCSDYIGWFVCLCLCWLVLFFACFLAGCRAYLSVRLFVCLFVCLLFLVAADSFTTKGNTPSAPLEIVGPTALACVPFWLLSFVLVVVCLIAFMFNVIAQLLFCCVFVDVSAVAEPLGITISAEGFTEKGNTPFGPLESVGSTALTGGLHAFGIVARIEVRAFVAAFAAY